MKTLRLIGMAMFAVLMCVNFATCSSEEVMPDEPTSEKYITVKFDCVGEYLNVTDSPLSRAVTNDLYGIQIYTIEDENLSENEGGIKPYAYGIFNTLNNINAKLLAHKTYKFKVSIVTNGYSKGFEYMANSNINSYADSTFTYSSSIELYVDNSRGYREDTWGFERFYGELNKYTPSEDETISIETKRVSYGAKYIAESLSEGYINIETTNNNSIKVHTINLSTTNLVNDSIYTFTNIVDAYQSNDYSSEKELTINWTKNNGEVIPLGTYKVTFKRNIRTTIRIKAEELSVNNGITVTKEDTSISDNDNEYQIEGGKIVEVPINSAS